MAQPFLNHIGGRWVPARSGRTFANHNPANGEGLGEYPGSGPEDVNDAVEAAAGRLGAPASTTEKGRVAFIIIIRRFARPLCPPERRDDPVALALSSPKSASSRERTAANITLCSGIGSVCPVRSTTTAFIVDEMSIQQNGAFTRPVSSPTSDAGDAVDSLAWRGECRNLRWCPT